MLQKYCNFAMKLKQTNVEPSYPNYRSKSGTEMGQIVCFCNQTGICLSFL